MDGRDGDGVCIRPSMRLVEDSFSGLGASNCHFHCQYTVDHTTLKTVT
jgi:hypothetical protein